MSKKLNRILMLVGATLLCAGFVFAGGFSDSANGSPNTSAYRSGTVTVPTGAVCQYFGGFISDGHNPPGTASINGPLGYDYIDVNGHSNPADLNPTSIAAGNYNYYLQANGMAYCGLAINW